VICTEAVHEAAPITVHVSVGPPDGADASISDESSAKPDGPVLIIEDHADTRRMVEMFLEFHGIPSVSAENGHAGLLALEKYRPSIILLDLSMPVMDGRQFRAAQQNLANAALAAVPVVVMSAEHNCVLEGEQMGAVEVIEKPIDMDRMVAVVRTHCRQASAAASDARMKVL
jgi:DNA-binding response OmpR family regulator